MRYLHYILDQNQNQLESTYSDSLNTKLSMECLVNVNSELVYKIWDRNTNEIINVK
jgi:hypothetical protein